MSTLFSLPRQFTVDGSGSPRAGAKLNFYEAGTLTQQNTFSDNDLSVANTNPVIADSAGVFGPIYLSNLAYRVILTDSNDVQIWDQDNYNAPLLGLFGGNVLTKNGNYTVVADDKGSIIDVTAMATISLLAAATAGAGFTLLIENTGSSTVTVDPNSSELINGAASLSIGQDGWAIIVCDGSSWIAVTGRTVEGVANAGNLTTGTLPNARFQTEGSVTINWTGFSTAEDSTVYYTKVGNIVVLRFSNVPSATSNATGFSSGTGELPAIIRPVLTSSFSVRVQDNGAWEVGVLSISSSGTISLTTQDGTGFTASGTKSFQGSLNVSYTLNPTSI